MLTASQLMVTRDERIRLTDGYNLEISELEPQDAGDYVHHLLLGCFLSKVISFFSGDYVCQISDKQNKDQIHTVEILGKLKPKAKKS